MSSAVGVVHAIDQATFESLGHFDDWDLSPAATRTLNCSRQSGKSTVGVILALRHALYYPESWYRP